MTAASSCPEAGELKHRRRKGHGRLGSWAAAGHGSRHAATQRDQSLLPRPHKRGQGLPPAVGCCTTTAQDFLSLISGGNSN